MSYDIGLYDKRFLKRAIDEDLGDWTNATPIPADKSKQVEDRLEEAGYKLEHDSTLCREWIHPKEEWGLQVSVFDSEIAFTVPYWDDCENAIVHASGLAERLSQEFDLGLHDPQIG